MGGDGKAGEKVGLSDKVVERGDLLGKAVGVKQPCGELLVEL
jgi:hypothetical protein